ncbi:hypothetical protein EMCRGX_G002548 [Ephydatia muelleri]
MLALVWAVHIFRPYLYGKRFTLRTDHNCLKWLHNFKEPEWQVASAIFSQIDVSLVSAGSYNHCGLKGLLKNGILYRQWEDIPGGGMNKHLQLVLPSAWIPDVLYGCHNSIIAGHLGVRKTLEKIQHRFYWPGHGKDVEMWCGKCAVCRSRKTVSMVSRPLERVAMDILGPLPETPRGTRAFVNEFVCRFGVPESLHTDLGKNFESALIKEICQLLGVKMTRTTPYHPQSDGLVERFNRTVLDMLSMAVQQDEHGWDLLLPPVMLAYRTSVQETTGTTPFSLLFGRTSP